MLPFSRAEEAAISFANFVQDFNLLDDKELCEKMVHWNVELGVLPPRAAAAMLGKAENLPTATIARRTRDLGQAVRHLIHAAAKAGPAGPMDLRILNAELGAAVGRGQLVRGPRRLDWGWTPTTAPLERVLWVPSVSASRLLTRGDFERLRVCAAPLCERLFLDRTRNGRRRWCSMSRCGNRAKAARFRNRRGSARDPHSV